LRSSVCTISRRWAGPWAALFGRTGMRADPDQR
jgi:hypothetical protein